MFTGAVAVNFWGRPRLTHDIDVVVFMQEKEIEKLAQNLGKGFSFDREGATEAIKKRRMFNLLHLKTGIKVNLWPLKKDIYDQTRLKGRVREKILGRKTWLISPEDLIITKLVWFKELEIQKHLEDIRGIYQIQKGRLDEKYLRKWAEKQKVEELLKELNGGKNQS